MTAVEYLIKEFSNVLGKIQTKSLKDSILLIDAIEQAKEMEKQQIIDAHGQKKDYSFSQIDPQTITGEQYYNATYKNPNK
jgi:hypothetical protein